MNIFTSLLITIVTMAFGQVLVKKGMLNAGPVPSGSTDIVMFLLKNMTTNPHIIGGLLLAVFSTGGWMITLSKAELSFAYPFMSLAFPLVLVLSGFFLGESIPLMRWIGLAVVLLGLYFISKSN
jgi:drug/metabolite transporter (DMT)-like permease